MQKQGPMYPEVEFLHSSTPGRGRTKGSAVMDVSTANGQPTAVRDGERADLARLIRQFRAGGPLTRADVVRLSGLSRVTANLRLDALLSARLVVPGEPGTSTGGRRPAAFTFNNQRGVLLIADMGATGMRIAVC